MALSVISSPQIVTGTLGQQSVVCCQFRSDQILTGKVVKFNPALFVTSQTSTPTTTANQWIVQYPANGVTENFNFVGDSVNKNWQATIQAIDEQNFIVCLEFFWLSDLNNYLGDFSYNNYQIFNNNGLGQSVYDTQKRINFYIEVDGDSVICSQPAEGNDFCQDTVNFDLGTLDGFEPNQDFEIKINIPQVGIGNIFYIGFIETNSVSNNLDFVRDYRLNYGLVANGVVSPATIGVLNNDISCFNGGQGFTNNGTETNGSVTIAGNCLKEGEKYKIYVVYRKNGEWRSCLSQDICQRKNAGLPTIPGDVFECLITDALGQEFTNCCVSGLAACGNLNIAIRLKRTEIETAIQSIYTGNLETYLSNFNLFFSNFAPTSPLSGVLALNYTSTLDANGLLLETTYNLDNLTGDLYFTACFEFNYGSLLSPNIQKIYMPLKVSLNGNVIPIVPTFTLNGEDVIDQFCCEDQGLLQINTGLTGCEFFLSRGFSNFESIGENLSEVDVNKLECEVKNCVKLVCSGTTSVDPLDDCDCPQCSDIEVTVDTPFIPGDPNRELIIGAPLGCTITATELNSGLTNTGTTNTFISIPSAQTSYSLLIEVSCPNGCGGYSGSINGLFEGNSGTNSIMLSSDSTEDCDCETCDSVNLGWVEFECDDNGIVSWSTQIDLESTVESDTDQSEEFQDSNGNLIKVAVLRIIKFTDSCEDLIIEDVIDCPVNLICINDRQISYTIDDDCNLELTFTDSLMSPVLGDEYSISVNGNKQSFTNLNPYNNDIQVCDGDFISIISRLVFDDGCVDELTELIFQVSELQQNTRVITCSVVDGFLNIPIVDSFIDNPTKDTLFISINGTQTQFDQLINGYNNDLPVSDGDVICINSETEFDKCCTPKLITPILKKNINISIDCSAVQLTCEYDEEACTFEIKYSGGTGKPVFYLNGAKGFEVPSSPFLISGSGQLIAEWELPEPCENKIVACKSPTENDPITLANDCLNVMVKNDCLPVGECKPTPNAGTSNNLAGK